ncbi:unnamed protein product, partial [Parnassius mnemosyne]
MNESLLSCWERREDCRSEEILSIDGTNGGANLSRNKSTVLLSIKGDLGGLKADLNLRIFCQTSDGEMSGEIEAQKDFQPLNLFCFNNLRVLVIRLQRILKFCVV